MLLVIDTDSCCACGLSCAGLFDAAPSADMAFKIDEGEKSVCADAVRSRAEMMVSRMPFACTLNSACCEALVKLAADTVSSELT